MVDSNSEGISLTIYQSKIINLKEAQRSDVRVSDLSKFLYFKKRVGMGLYPQRKYLSEIFHSFQMGNQYENITELLKLIHTMIYMTTRG